MTQGDPRVVARERMYLVEEADGTVPLLRRVEFQRRVRRRPQQDDSLLPVAAVFPLRQNMRVSSRQRQLDCQARRILVPLHRRSWPAALSQHFRSFCPWSFALRGNGASVMLCHVSTNAWGVFAWRNMLWN